MAKAMVGELRDRIRGRVIEEGDADYDAARHVHNAMIDRRPDAIVRPESNADVAATVQHAHEKGVDLAVRGDGSVVRASADENDDLFWAIRGGGGNFGVVTTFDFKLHPVSALYGGPIVFALDSGPDVMRAYVDAVENAPEELGIFFAYLIAP